MSNTQSMEGRLSSSYLHKQICCHGQNAWPKCWSTHGRLLCKRESSPNEVEAGAHPAQPLAPILDPCAAVHSLHIHQDNQMEAQGYLMRWKRSSTQSSPSSSSSAVIRGAPLA